MHYTLCIRIEKYKLQAATARIKQARASTARASKGAYCGASVETVGFSKIPFIDFDAKLMHYDCATCYPYVLKSMNYKQQHSKNKTSKGINSKSIKRSI